MASFVVLANFTEQGARNVKEIPQRRQRALELAEKMGVNVTGRFLTMGAYDLVLTLEAPDDEAATRFVLTLGSQGNLHTTTLRAYSDQEMDRIAAGLG
jgi:uncharacterized protein with GYD domain